MLQPVGGASAHPSHSGYASPAQSSAASGRLQHAPLLLGDLEFVVLSLLQQDSRYGLELLLAVQQLQRRLEGRLSFSPGQLHPVLGGLEEAGLIYREQRFLSDLGAGRAYYILTHRGQAALSAA